MLVVKYNVEDFENGIRVLPITDRHNRDKDFDTVGGFVKIQERINEDIIKFMKNDSYKTIGINMGDSYDQGYRSVAMAYCHVAQERRIATACDWDYYTIVGNHMYLQRDSNPEFLMLQPDSRFPTKKKLCLTEEDKIYKVIDAIIIGDVQISMVHYEEINKQYKRPKLPGVKFHIAMFHDDNVIPSSIKQGRGMHTTISSEYLTDLLEDVDLAVVAHWHEDIGLVNVHVGNRIVPMYIPGALCHTSVSMSERHKKVTLPTFIFDKDGMRIETVDFKTYLNELKFYVSNESDFKKKQKQEAKNNKKLDIKDVGEIEVESFDTIDFIRASSLGGVAVKLYKEASKGSLTVIKALDITKEALHDS